MHRLVRHHPPVNLWIAFFSGLALLGAISGVAQKPSAGSQPKYDLQTESKIKGSVDEVKAPPKGSKEVVHLAMKSGTEMIDVYLCPQGFLDEMGMSFAKGDEIVVKGSKVKVGDAELVLAREVGKGTDTLILRDDKGNPIWSWHH